MSIFINSLKNTLSCEIHKVYQFCSSTQILNTNSFVQIYTVCGTTLLPFTSALLHFTCIHSGERKYVET